MTKEITSTMSSDRNDTPGNITCKDDLKHIRTEEFVESFNSLKSSVDKVLYLMGTNHRMSKGKKDPLEGSGDRDSINGAQHQDLDQAETQSGQNDQVLQDIMLTIEPIINKLYLSGLNNKQEEYLRLLHDNLRETCASSVIANDSEDLNFTCSEIQTLNLIKLGKSTKEIAAIKNLSPRTIEYHRNNIRKKLKLSGKKMRLGSYLRNINMGC
jgi:DNA-binding CsgD family transcriptional regulator